MTSPLSNEIPKPLTPLTNNSIKPQQDPDIEIDPKKSLPEETNQLDEEMIDKIKLKETVDDSISLQEQRKPNVKLAIALGITVGILILPIIASGFVLGALGGSVLGVVKNKFMWDYEYAKSIKTIDYPLMGKIKPIKAEAADLAMLMGLALPIFLIIKSNLMSKLIEERVRRESNKV